MSVVASSRVCNLNFVFKNVDKCLKEDYRLFFKIIYYR
jgi:hypothetical protein